MTYQNPTLCKTPKNSCLSLCRIQKPFNARLQVEWSLHSRGAWGHIFKYSTNELSFCSLEERKSFGQHTIKAVLTSAHWAVSSLLAFICREKRVICAWNTKGGHRAIIPRQNDRDYPHGERRDRGDSYHPSAGDKYYCLQYDLGNKWLCYWPLACASQPSGCEAWGKSRSVNDGAL